MVQVNLDTYPKKNKIMPISFTPYKNKLRVNESKIFCKLEVLIWATTWVILVSKCHVAARVILICVASSATWGHGDIQAQATVKLQRLKGQPGSLRGTDLGTLHICDSCVTWSSCGTSNSGNRGCL